MHLAGAGTRSRHDHAPIRLHAGRLALQALTLWVAPSAALIAWNHTTQETVTVTQPDRPLDETIYLPGQ